jgi:hypothetical protein
VSSKKSNTIKYKTQNKCKPASQNMLDNKERYMQRLWRVEHHIFEKLLMIVKIYSTFNSAMVDWFFWQFA